jgi:hypothetical protein
VDRKNGRVVEVIKGKSYEKWVPISGKWTTHLMDGAAYPDKKTLIDATYGSGQRKKQAGWEYTIFKPHVLLRNS